MEPVEVAHLANQKIDALQHPLNASLFEKRFPKFSDETLLLRMIDGNMHQR